MSTLRMRSMDDPHGVTPQPGDPVGFVLDDGTTIPAMMIQRRYDGCVIRIEAHHLRIGAPAVTTVSPDRLIR